MSNLYIQGVCGTFMAGVAVLAKQLGYAVRGSDQAMYPPMDKQLLMHNILVDFGYDKLIPVDLFSPDHVIIGNSLSRGMLQVEQALGLSFSSAPVWLQQNILLKRKVLAVAGTHGKTSTTSMLLWILMNAGLKPGYLIGGVPSFVDSSADIGQDEWFIIEADEYDSAFFDKKAKFLSFTPFAAIINNLELDHLDIYNNLQEIESVFSQWVNVLPNNGGLICPKSEALAAVAHKASKMTRVDYLHNNDDHCMQVDKNNEATAVWRYKGKIQAEFSAPWVCGHMLENALAAAVMAHNHVGVSIEKIIDGLVSYPGVARRMELKWQIGNKFLYDDFAHHPTAISKTLQALANKHKGKPLILCLELSSYSLKSNKQFGLLLDSLLLADKVLVLKPKGDGCTLDFSKLSQSLPNKLKLCVSAKILLAELEMLLVDDSVVVTISSKDFQGVRQELFDLADKTTII